LLPCYFGAYLSCDRATHVRSPKWVSSVHRQIIFCKCQCKLHRASCVPRYWQVCTSGTSVRSFTFGHYSMFVNTIIVDTHACHVGFVCEHRLLRSRPCTPTIVRIADPTCLCAGPYTSCNLGCCLPACLLGRHSVLGWWGGCTDCTHERLPESARCQIVLGF
jgi:hypothetical protein